MPTLEDKFDLGKTIGSIESSVGSIQNTVDKVNLKVDSLGDKLSHLNHTTVKKNECSEGCGKVERKVDSVRQELVGIRQDLAKKQTRKEVPTLNSFADDTKRFRVSSVISPVAIEEEKPSKRNILQRVKDNAVAITAIIGFLTLVGAGFLNLARFVVRVETVLEENKQATKAQTKKLEKEIRRIDESKPRIVYLPARPDARVKPRPARPRPRRSRRTSRPTPP